MMPPCPCFCTSRGIDSDRMEHVSQNFGEYENKLLFSILLNFRVKGLFINNNVFQTFTLMNIHFLPILQSIYQHIKILMFKMI